MTWQERAACRGSDPAMFFLERELSEAVADAKAVCAGCEVKAECLEYALANREVDGVWGGTSEKQRRRIRRQRREQGSLAVGYLG